jgi:hypothetical protein
MIGDCVHPNFNEDGVCTCCREFYSTEHDQHPNDIHPAMLRLLKRCAERSQDQLSEQP